MLIKGVAFFPHCCYYIFFGSPPSQTLHLFLKISHCLVLYKLGSLVLAFNSFFYLLQHSMNA